MRRKGLKQIAKQLDPTRLVDLLIVGRGTSVVLVAPDPVPDSGDEAGKHEDHGGVVDSLGGDGDGGGHAEQGQGQKGPG